jgi:hypothetical protein
MRLCVCVCGARRAKAWRLQPKCLNQGSAPRHGGCNRGAKAARRDNNQDGPGRAKRPGDNGLRKMKMRGYKKNCQMFFTCPLAVIRDTMHAYGVNNVFSLRGSLAISKCSENCTARLTSAPPHGCQVTVAHSHYSRTTTTPGHHNRQPGHHNRQLVGAVVLAPEFRGRVATPAAKTKGTPYGRIVCCALAAKARPWPLSGVNGFAGIFLVLPNLRGVWPCKLAPNF